MKLLRSLAFALALIPGATSSLAAGQNTWIVIGDSIMSFTGDGQAKDHALSLITTERNVAFKNISSPGATLGGENFMGFDNTTTTAELDQICGYFSYCNGFIIQAGVNDSGTSTPLNQMTDSIRRILQYARDHKKKTLVLDIIWSAKENAPNSLGYTVTQYRDVRKASCTVAYPDVCTFADRATTPLGSPSATLYTAAEVATSSQLHPNVAGQRAYADWIESAAKTAGLF